MSGKKKETLIPGRFRNSSLLIEVGQCTPGFQPLGFPSPIAPLNVDHDGSHTLGFPLPNPWTAAEELATLNGIHASNASYQEFFMPEQHFLEQQALNPQYPQTYTDLSELQDVHNNPTTLNGMFSNLQGMDAGTEPQAYTRLPQETNHEASNNGVLSSLRPLSATPGDTLAVVSSVAAAKTNEHVSKNEKYVSYLYHMNLCLQSPGPKGFKRRGSSVSTKDAKPRSRDHMK